QQPQQGQLAAPGEAVDDPAGEGDGRRAAAETPQGGTGRQAQHGGRGKARHQQQGGAGAAGEGRQARGRQRHRQQGRDHRHHQQVGQPAEDRAHQHRAAGEQQQLVTVKAQSGPLLGPEAAQHGADVVVALAVAAGRQGGGGGGWGAGQRGGGGEVV